MITRYRVALAACALTLASCQGSFGNGGASTGMNPPVNQQAAAANLSPSPSPSPSPSISPPPGVKVTYPFADAAKGYKCPEEQGFSCTLRFNVLNDATPTPAPSPSGKGKGSPTPSPTPTPTPTPSPTPSASSSSSPSPAASGTPSATQLTIRIGALPKDAPKMESPNPAATKTTALFTVRLTADTDAILLGKAFADFTLPKEQIGTRMFAVQLFHEMISSKKKVTDSYIGSYIESKVDGETVSFSLDVPKFQIKKDEVWLIVLYGEDVPPSGAPSASPSGSPSASPSVSPSASPSVSPSASPSVKPSSTP